MRPIAMVGVASLREKGITNPAEHVPGKTIRAPGNVKSVDDVPRVEIDDAKRIRIMDDK